MSREGQIVDKKSLRAITLKSPDWKELARDCAAFAMARGGTILFGIEDKDSMPPKEQVIEDHLPDLLQHEIAQRTVNVDTTAEIKTAKNGGQYIELRILFSPNVPSTTKGEYLIRIDDSRKPVTGDELQRIASDRSTFPWESKLTEIESKRADKVQVKTLIRELKQSDRVKAHIKNKSDAELLKHYGLTTDGKLTHVGVLCIGAASDRARLGTAPVIEVIRYDTHGNKVQKYVWDDYLLSPQQLVQSVLADVSDFREEYEIPHGFLRDVVPVYDQRVVRELLVNALVHRPYTQRGDIFISLYPDRLEIVNPGCLPIGVTPENVLHRSVRRNDQLARIFHDLGLMEREGSGFDLMYEVLLSQGRPIPQVFGEVDRVRIVIKRKVFDPQIIQLMKEADARFQLTQKEKICFGLLAQNGDRKALELMIDLELESVEELQPWLERLLKFGIVHKTGRTRAMKYFVKPDILQSADLPVTTDLARIEPYRLRELIIEDLQRHPDSSIGSLRGRVGNEIDYKKVKRAIDFLVKKGQVIYHGERKGRKYRLA